jgi:Cytochrome P460
MQMKAGLRKEFLIPLAVCVAVACGLLGIAAALAQTPTATQPRVAQPAPDKPLQVARFDTKGNLLKPTDLSNWVFLGTSLGMGYNPGSFNAANPGQFQVVLMEPNAYRYFVAHGRYAPGSMFLLSFYNSDQKQSINQTGFVQADLTNYEIHLLDPSRSPDGRVFYMFDAKDGAGHPMPAGNQCVQCHVKNGAFDGTFAQFYPTIRHQIPKEALERVMHLKEIR